MIDPCLLTCAEILKARELTVAFAESATAGRVTADFSAVPFAGTYLKGGFICYNVCLKEESLHVPKAMIEKYTPESAEVTEAIAVGLQSLIPAAIHVGITGLPRPGGSETDEKPVGTMFIHALKFGKHLFSERILFTGSSEQIICATVRHTAVLLTDCLREA